MMVNTDSKSNPRQLLLPIEVVACDHLATTSKQSETDNKKTLTCFTRSEPTLWSRG